MVFALCVAKGKNGVVFSNLKSEARFGLPKYIESLGGHRCFKWLVAEYKNMEVVVYAENIVSEADDLSKVSLILPVQGESNPTLDRSGYSDAFVVGPAFLCLAYKSNKGIGKGQLLDKERGLTEWFSTHVKKLSLGKDYAALFMPDFGGEYHPVELMNLGGTR